MDDKKYIIYCYTNKLNGKKYIGLTSRSLQEREAQHIRESIDKDNYRTYNTPFKRAIRKYGINTFQKEILEDNLTMQEAIEQEQYYIKLYRTYYKYKNSNGYNATIGGELVIHPKDRVYKIDPITCKVIAIYESIAEAEIYNKGDIYESYNKLNRIANDSIWMLEQNYLDYDKNLLEQNIHIQQHHIVQLDLNGTLLKIWAGSKYVTKELGYNQGNISACCRGVRHHCKGYRWLFYEDWIQNKDPYIKNNRNKKVAQLTLDNKLIRIYDSASEAAQCTNIDIANISAVCHNRALTAGGFKWSYDVERWRIDNELS